MKPYVTVVVSRGHMGRLDSDVSDFMGKGYMPHGGLVVSGDLLIQPMIYLNWKVLAEEGRQVPTNLWDQLDDHEPRPEPEE